MARLVGAKGVVSEGAFCNPCAEAFCRVNKVGMPLALETQKTENIETQKQLSIPSATAEERWKPEWVG